MRGRRRYRAPRRPRIPPSAAIAPVAQHRGGNAQLACELAQRPTAAHQQSHRFPLELIRKMTPFLAHSTPFRSRRSLAKVSTNLGEPQFNSVLTAPAVTLKLLRQVIKSGTGTDLVTEAYSLCMKFPVFVEWCWTWVITALS